MIITNDIVVMYGGRALMALIMILSNSILVIVTFKTKYLNSTCNLLIAANSACIALYAPTYFVQFGIVLFSPSGIPLWQCCVLVCAPLFFMCCQYVLFPLIALDRLIGVILPLKQMGSRYKRRFMLFALGASTSFGFFMVAASINKSIISENLVRCMTHDVAPDYFANCSWVLNISSVILYLALWVRVKIMASSNASGGEIYTNEAVTRKVLFSLIVIFLVETFGWSTTWSVKLVLVQFGVDSTTQLYVLGYCIYAMQLSLALYAPILYALSSDYRLAFRTMLCIGKNVHPNIVQVIPINKNGQTNGGKTI